MERIPQCIKEIFKDIKIIELSSVLAGPLVGSYFAELGAQVIKVENKTSGGDVTRRWHLKQEDPEQLSAYYQAANYGKESVFLDLSRAQDRQELYAHVRDASVVINNIKLDSTRKLGVHPADIRAIKKDIIYAQLDGFDDEDAHRVAYDMALQAETGFLSMTGIPPDQDSSAYANNLAKMPVALIDVLAAHQLKEAILVSLIKQMKTGEGTYLRASLYGVALTSQKNQATNYLLVDHIPEPMGTLHPNIAPYGEILQFKDDIRVVLAVGSDKQFEALLKILNLVGMEKNSNFMQNSDRLQNREKLYDILRRAALTIEFREVRDLFEAQKIPYGEIKDLKEVWDSESAAKYRNRNTNTPLHSAIHFRNINYI